MDTFTVSDRAAQPKTRASAHQGQSDHTGQSILDILRSHKKALTVPYVAELLGCSPKTIYAMVKQKRLPAFFLGAAVRLDPHHVADWLLNNSTVAV
jgi:excisionase family DNA binding protein